MRHSVLALLSFAVLAAPAQAATAPAPHTAPATNVGPLSATLNGSVNANGHATTIHFEWGKTKKYGNRTPNQAVGAGTKRSGDRSLKPAKPPTPPTIPPNPPVFSRPFTISGQLLGTGSGHA